MGGGGGKGLGENGVMKKEEDRCGKKVELREKKKKTSFTTISSSTASAL